MNGGRFTIKHDCHIITDRGIFTYRTANLSLTCGEIFCRQDIITRNGINGDGGFSREIDGVMMRHIFVDGIACRILTVNMRSNGVALKQVVV